MSDIVVKRISKVKVRKNAARKKEKKVKPPKEKNQKLPVNNGYKNIESKRLEDRNEELLCWRVETSVTTKMKDDIERMCVYFDQDTTETLRILIKTAITYLDSVI